MFYLLNPLDRFNIFIAVDGTFGLVTSTYTDVSNKVPQVDLIDPTELTFRLYVTFIKLSDAVDYFINLQYRTYE